MCVKKFFIIFYFQIHNCSYDLIPAAFQILVNAKVIKKQKTDIIIKNVIVIPNHFQTFVLRGHLILLTSFIKFLVVESILGILFLFCSSIISPLYVMFENYNICRIFLFLIFVLCFCLSNNFYANNLCMLMLFF